MRIKASEAASFIVTITLYNTITISVMNRYLERCVATDSCYRRCILLNIIVNASFPSFSPILKNKIEFTYRRVTGSIKEAINFWVGIWADILVQALSMLSLWILLSMLLF